VSRRARLSNGLLCFASRARHRRFVAALDEPERAQAEVLAEILRANRASEPGRRFGFAELGSPTAFSARVPLHEHADLAGALERIRAGQRGVLTAARVERLIPTSGSSGARKLVPCTRALLAQFRRALGPWLVDLYARRALRAGRAYWAVSPALPEERDGPVPVGFADDGEYLGRLGRALLAPGLAVAGEVRHVHDPEAFRYAVLLQLLAARDLALISVWHPSYLTRLLDALPAHWERLLSDLAHGGLRPPGALSEPLRRRLAARLAPDRSRAAELAALGPEAPAALWPRLALVSAWGDAAAAGALAELRARLPGVELQPKGLIATEAFVSVPFAGARPLALRSHFFEFLDAAGRARGAGELEARGEYALVVTTGGGLYRYRLHDRVRVEGFLGRTPTLAFLGREDGIVDRCGEKLSDAFVAGTLERVLAGLDARFAMLAPAPRAAREGYALFLECAPEPPPGLARALEAELAASPHYAWCVRLGQLAPVRVVRVGPGAHAAYLERARELGQKLGDVKPAALSARTDWERWLPAPAAAAGAPGPRAAR
jgi:hypothetical protein